MPYNIGVDGISRNAEEIAVGVDGVSRFVASGYIGVDGVARKFFSRGKFIRRCFFLCAKTGADNEKTSSVYAVALDQTDGQDAIEIPLKTPIFLFYKNRGVVIAKSTPRFFYDPKTRRLAIFGNSGTGAGTSAAYTVQVIDCNTNKCIDSKTFSTNGLLDVYYSFELGRIFMFGGVSESDSSTIYLHSYNIRTLKVATKSTAFTYTNITTLSFFIVPGYWYDSEKTAIGAFAFRHRAAGSANIQSYVFTLSYDGDTDGTLEFANPSQQLPTGGATSSYLIVGVPGSFVKRSAVSSEGVCFISNTSAHVSNTGYIINPVYGYKGDTFTIRASYLANKVIHQNNTHGYLWPQGQTTSGTSGAYIGGWNGSSATEVSNPFGETNNSATIVNTAPIIGGATVSGTASTSQLYAYKGGNFYNIFRTDLGAYLTNLSLNLWQLKEHFVFFKTTGNLPTIDSVIQKYDYTTLSWADVNITDVISKFSCLKLSHWSGVQSTWSLDEQESLIDLETDWSQVK